MSMGYGANVVEVIDASTLKKIVGEETFKQFLSLTDKCFTCPCAAADYLNGDDNEGIVDGMEDKVDECAVILDKIIETFESKTGLRLSLEYHDQDNDGDKYDEVDGLYWAVYGCYTMSPEMKKFINDYGDGHINSKFFVTFG